MKRLASEVLRRQLPATVGLEITTSDQCHLANFARLGGWPAWIEYVATGVRYDDRAPVYNAYIIHETELGRANADIMKKAKAAGKLCMYLDHESASLTQVDSIIEVDPNNWKSGWAAVIR